MREGIWPLRESSQRVERVPLNAADQARCWTRAEMDRKDRVTLAQLVRSLDAQLPLLRASSSSPHPQLDYLALLGLQTVRASCCDVLEVALIPCIETDCETCPTAARAGAQRARRGE